MSETSTGMSAQTKGRLISNSIYAGIIGFFFIKYDIMSKLVALMENTLYFGILAVITFMLGVGLFSETGRALIFFIPQFISDTILDRLIGLNPISAYRSLIRFMEKKAKEVRAALADMKAVRNKSEAAINQYEAEFNEASRLAKAAQRMGAEGETALATQAGKMTRRKAAIDKAKKGLTFANTMITSLERALAVIMYRIEDARDSIKMLQEDHELAIATLAAAGSAQDAADAINGTGMQADIAERARDVVRGQVAQAQAEVELLLSEISAPASEMDLTKLANSIEGERMLADLQNRVSESERNASQKLITSGPATPLVSTATSNDYAAMFRR